MSDMLKKQRQREEDHGMRLLVREMLMTMLAVDCSIKLMLQAAECCRTRQLNAAGSWRRTTHLVMRLPIVTTIS